ncbi:hypothetical protein [Pseudomonas putida]
MGGRISVESVVRCSWNGWPDDRGIRKLTATGLKRYLEAWQQAKARGRIIGDHDYAPEAGSQVSHADLNAYARIGQSTGHGVTQ